MSDDEIKVESEGDAVTFTFGKGGMTIPQLARYGGDDKAGAEFLAMFIKRMAPPDFPSTPEIFAYVDRLVEIVSDESTSDGGRATAMKSLCVLYDAYSVGS
jgi:hypothetical protein